MESDKDIFQQLKLEHKNIVRILKTLRGAEAKDKDECISELEYALICHLKAEEKVLYSMVRKRAMTEHKDEDISLTNESSREHREIVAFFNKLQATGPQTNSWDEMTGALLSNVTYHIRKEEDEFFDVCKDNLTKGEQSHLYDKYMKAKKDYYQTHIKSA